MSTAQLSKDIVSARDALRRAMEESKIDMGVADVPRTRPLNILKQWDSLKSPPPAEPLSFDSLLGKTGT